MSTAQSSVREPGGNEPAVLAGRSLAVAAAVLIVLLIAAPTPSLAQTTSVAPAASAAPTTLLAQASGTATTAQAGAAAGEQLEQVTVTAERVAAPEQSIPIAITAISTQQMTQENIITPDQLEGLVPSLNILGQNGDGAGSLGENQMAILIRGVGTGGFYSTSDTGVGVYLDDVYLANTRNLGLSFFDLQSVQVLEGPQGTLFGRNSFGGAVLLYTTPPTQQFGGYAQVRVGSFNRVDIEGAVNMPFSDVLTSRFDFYTSNVDGYITHLLNSATNDDIHEKSGRFQLHFQPGSAFSADLLTEYGASDDNGNEEITVGCNPNAFYVQNYAAAHPTSEPYCTQFKPIGQPYEVYGNTVSNFPEPTYAYGPGSNPDGSGGPILGPSGLTSSSGGRTPFDEGVMATVALRMSWIVNDAVTLKSITGLRRSDLTSFRDDGTTVGLYTEQDDTWDENYSEELQGLIKLWGGRLSLTTGLFYYIDSAASIQDTGPDYVDPVGYYYGNIVSEHSWAAYAQGTLAVTDKFSIIGGVRNTHDYKTSSSEVWEGCYGSYLEEYTTGTGGCWIPGPSMADYATATGQWTHTDPRLQFQYQWTPAVMTYVSASSGYISGGFNPIAYFPPPPYNEPYEEETLWNYEVGLKSEWFHHRLRFNIDGYDQIINNIQSGVLQYYNGIDVTTVTSAADGHERGVEVELDAIPVDNLTLQATFSTLGQAYDAVFPSALANGLCKCAALTTAPLKQASLAVNYTFHLPNGATFVPDVNWRYEGQEWSGTYPLQYLAPGYAAVGANLTYNSPGNKWSIAYWCTNCTNKYYFLTYASPNVLDTNIGLEQVTPGRPREMGALFRWNF